MCPRRGNDPASGHPRAHQPPLGREDRMIETGMTDRRNSAMQQCTPRAKEGAGPCRRAATWTTARPLSTA